MAPVRARLLAALLLAACGARGGAEADRAGPLPAPGRRIAVYAQGGAIVVDRRWIDVPAGASRVELGELAATMLPASLTMRVLAGPGPLEVRRRTFDPGLARAPALAEAILAGSIGRPVEIERRGARLRGRLAAVHGGELVIARGGALMTVPWRDADALALGGRRRVGRPTLIAELVAARAGRHLVELVYAADGMSFTARYAIRLRGRSAEVRPAAELANASGLDLGGAQLALHAGRLGASAESERPALFWRGRVELAAEPGRAETRQLAFPLARVAARIEPVYQGAVADAANPPGEPAYGTAMQPAVVRHLLVATGGGRLPAVLPAGDAVVEIDGAPGAPPERLATRLAERVAGGGEARFELDAERQLLGDRRQVRVDRAPDGRQLTEAYELTVRNTGGAPARVRVVEPLTRSLRVTVNRAEPAPAARREGRLEWLVEVPPRGEAKVAYEATYRF